MLHAQLVLSVDGDPDSRPMINVLADLVTGELERHMGDAVLLCTGGYSNVYFLSTNAGNSNVSATWRCPRRGAYFANPCFAQVHPTCIPETGDYQAKLTLMSESLRNDGRVWVPKKADDTRSPEQIPDAERDYYLERRYPSFGNLVPRDIATREIFNICVNEGLSVEADRQCVYLDLTHISRRELDRKLGRILEIYEKSQGVDPRDVPMKIFPAVHYSMGGLWVDYERTDEGGLQRGSPQNQVTNIPGLYAIGEVDYQYHGGNPKN